jgi:hypothetical protein
LNGAISALRSGTLVQPPRLPVASYLVEEWLAAARIAGPRNSTWAAEALDIVSR